jgi:hypothetical protein
MPPNAVLYDDFVAFWSAGRLLLNGQNPYDAGLFQAIQASTGWSERLSFPMWYPPWAFSLVLPFAWLGYAEARIVWLGLNIILLVLCANLLWKVYEGPPRLRIVAWGIALIYCPDLFALRIGQITLFPLLGLVCFLMFLRQGNIWLAGAALSLASVKPHLAYLFWVVLLFWIIDRKRRRLALGLFGVLAFATTLNLCFNSHLVSQFIASRAILQVPLFAYKSPTLGSLLRLVFGEEKLWLRFVPGLLAFSGVLVYWLRNRTTWSWNEELPVLVAVSLPTAFYAWSYDFALLLPAIMQAAVLLCRQHWRRQLSFALVFIGLNMAGLAMNLMSIDDFAYVWFSPAVLVLYLACVRSQPQAVGRKIAATG